MGCLTTRPDLLYFIWTNNVVNLGMLEIFIPSFSNVSISFIYDTFIPHVLND